MPTGKIDIQLLLQGCRRGNRASQRKLYEHFYGYAMKISLRYARHREEAAEILNTAFLKVLTHPERYDPAYPFEGWLRRIVINAAIDYHRKHHKTPEPLELTDAADVAREEMSIPRLSPDEDLLPVLQRLPPAYRMVFNLYVMEEYPHHEIAEALGISVSTSRSNLMRAKEKLRELMGGDRRDAKFCVSAAATGKPPKRTEHG